MADDDGSGFWDGVIIATLVVCFPEVAIVAGIAGLAGGILYVAGAGALTLGKAFVEFVTAPSMSETAAQLAAVEAKIADLESQKRDLEDVLRGLIESTQGTKDEGALQRMRTLEMQISDVSQRIVDMRNQDSSLRRDQSARESAAVSIGMDIVTKYNFAVCGQGYAGKSTLINALRGLYPGDPDAAPEAVGRQGNQHATPYAFPNSPHLLLWDLPGGGVPGHPADTYCTDKNLKLFDGIIVAYNNGLSELDLKIIKFAVTNRRHVIVVYTKSGVDVRNIMHSTGGHASTAIATEEAAYRSLRAKVTAGFEDNLRTAGFSSQELRRLRVLFVDSHRLRKGTAAYDEVMLVNQLLVCTVARRSDGMSVQQALDAFSSRLSQSMRSRSEFLHSGSTVPSSTTEEPT